jgi:hypothetical protein
LVYDPREKGAIFEAERTSSILSFGPTLEKQLESFALVTMGQMKELTDERILEILTAISNRIGQKILVASRSLAGAMLFLESHQR